MQPYIVLATTAIGLAVLGYVVFRMDRRDRGRRDKDGQGK